MAQKTKILLTGGGTLGPVTPLLALAEAWQKKDPTVEFHWIGTPRGPEKELVEQVGIDFSGLSVPKLDRHRWWKWPLIIPHLLFSCFKAYQFLQNERPHLIFSAGAYVSVPLVWMAKLQGIPSWIHQLDVQPGLANKLMAPVARRISVTWEESVASFSAEKVLIVGGLARPKMATASVVDFERKYGLDDSKPTLLVTGGGTGAQAINEAMAVIGPQLIEKMNVVHLTGQGKMIESLRNIQGYVAEEFFAEDMAGAFNAADLVVARAGMGTILALVELKKPTILVPIPDSHQEQNARVLLEQDAAVSMSQFSPQLLKQEIEKLMSDRAARQKLSRRIEKALPMNAADKIINVAERLI